MTARTRTILFLAICIPLAVGLTALSLSYEDDGPCTSRLRGYPFAMAGTWCECFGPDRAGEGVSPLGVALNLGCYLVVTAGAAMLATGIASMTHHMRRGPLRRS